MKNQIEWLYLEDQQEDERRYGGWMLKVWERVNTSTVLKPHVWAKRIDDAENQIRSDPNRFDMVVIDIFSENSGQQEPLGLALLTELRRIRSDMVLVVLSIGGEDIARQAREAGADYYISKIHFTTEYPTAVAKIASDLEHMFRQRRWLLSAASQVELVLKPERDLALQALIERIGQDTIKDLLSQALDGSNF